jgi:hypothetical protein
LITILDDRLLIKISMKRAAGCRADLSGFGLDPLLAPQQVRRFPVPLTVDGAVHRP